MGTDYQQTKTSPKEETTEDAILQETDTRRNVLRNGALAVGGLSFGATDFSRWGVSEPPDSYPTGYDADGVDASRALAQHDQAVIESPSVQTNLSYEATANGGASIHIFETWTDLQRHVQLVNAKAIAGSGQRYAEDGMVYTKKKSSYTDNVSYDRTHGDILTERATGADVLEQVFSYLEFTLHETTTENDQSQFTYEATDFDTESFTIYLRQVETIRSFTASLTVDEQGRIHDFRFELDSWADDGNLLTVETAIELDSFGNTSVERPDWVDDEFG